MQEYRIAWVNYAKDIRGTWTMHAASRKNAFRIIARKMHSGARLKFHRDGRASTSHLAFTLED